jgi:hypothetical protein
MFVRLLARSVLGAAIVISSANLFGGAASADPNNNSLSGQVTDTTTGQVVKDACITIGPPVRCATQTDAQGKWFVSLQGAPDGLTWDVRILLGGQIKKEFLGVVVTGPTVINASVDATGFVQPVACPAIKPEVPTATNYLPNITKTLGGPSGWQTPFIVQNTGIANATLEVSWYRFVDGSCAKRITIDRAQGTSYAYVPNNDPVLDDNAQFAVVVRSYGATIVSVVNEHQGGGARAEAMSYDGFSAGSKNVFLPNITRRFCAGCRPGSPGFVTPFIIQNLGTTTTVATAQFVERATGQAAPVTVQLAIDPGKSKPIDPNSTAGLIDGKAYSVSIAADQPVAVVVNTHDDLGGVQSPIAYSADGIAAGAGTLYAPYAAKNSDGIARTSSIVVQNVGTTAGTPTLKFTPIGGGTATSFSLGNLDLSKSAAFDPRYTKGDTTLALCGSIASDGCLADGDYSVEVSGGGASIAAAVNVISGATGMGYTALATAGPKYFLPNVTRTLGGATGWTTPILLQSVTATSATLSWYRFVDGTLVTQQNVPLTPGSGVRIDPRNNPSLTDDTQYAVVVSATGGNVAAVVVELASGGDNAMIYEGFASQ